MSVFDDFFRVVLAIGLMLGGWWLCTLNVPGLFIIAAPIAVIGFAIGMSLAAGE